MYAIQNLATFMRRLKTRREACHQSWGNEKENARWWTRWPVNTSWKRNQTMISLVRFLYNNDEVLSVIDPGYTEFRSMCCCLQLQQCSTHLSDWSAAKFRSYLQIYFTNITCRRQLWIFFIIIGQYYIIKVFIVKVGFLFSLQYSAIR